MEVHISELTSVIRHADSQTLLDPRTLERVVRLVLERVREEREHEKRVSEETDFTASSTPEENVR